MYRESLEILYLLLPAIFANMSPVLAAHLLWLKSLNYPLDSCSTWRGRRLLGDHKTWRGLLAAAVIGLGVGLIQFYLSPLPPFSLFTLWSYNSATLSALFGLLLGLSALLGDAVV